MNNIQIAIIMFFVGLNFLAFFVMMIDKLKAGKLGSRRISEGLLFFLATCFGSIGVYAGMFAFRHKTRTWYFLIGIPLLIAENCAFLYLVYLYLGSNL